MRRVPIHRRVPVHAETGSKARASVRRKNKYVQILQESAPAAQVVAAKGTSGPLQEEAQHKKQDFAVTMFTLVLQSSKEEVPQVDPAV